MRLKIKYLMKYIEIVPRCARAVAVIEIYKGPCKKETNFTSDISIIKHNGMRGH